MLVITARESPMSTRFGRIAVACSGLLLAPPIDAQATQRVSVDSSGIQGDWYSSAAAISADGRFVVFQSDSTNLVAADSNAATDIFLHDRQFGTTRRMSIAWDGAQAADICGHPSISADGRHVAFNSRAGNLVPGDTNAMFDVFVRDRLAETTEIVSVGVAGVPGNSDSAGSQISADGRFVVFQSSADNLVPGDTNGFEDIFLRDRQLGTTERISVATGGAQGTGPSGGFAITPDARYVVFGSNADNLVSGDTNGRTDIFLRDRQAGTTERLSVDSNELQANQASFYPSISPDGRYAAFTSGATNLVPGDVNFFPDVFLRDRVQGTTELVSLNSGEGQGDFGCGPGAISADGRYVAFQSKARNLVPGDTNLKDDIFLRDRLLGTTGRVSVNAGGVQSDEDSFAPVLSADGRWIAFSSVATNLVSGDTNSTSDVFVHDRDSTGFASMCDPGIGALACPCSNPPSGPARGCDNSSATGGAALSAGGVTNLSADTLVFTTSGQRPTALSIVLQGTVFAGSGIVYGQGIRCVSGTLKRLYAKTAVGGSITAPDFGAGDPSVSARSAAKGDVIQAGQWRWYMVYYRDNTVLGGCPSTSTFNTTQTGMVSWSP